jgi:regulatory protein
LKDSERPPADAAYLKALDMLGRRDRSRGELRQKLAAKGFADPDLDEALERLTRQGFIDDAKFAARWVETALRNGRGYGLKLLTELRSRGIGRELAEQTLAAAAVETPAITVLAAIVGKRFASFDHQTATPQERQRVYAYLQRRGFSLSTILDYFRNH